jgi:hypothetical protein
MNSRDLGGGSVTPTDLGLMPRMTAAGLAGGAMAWKRSGVRFPLSPLCDVARHPGHPEPLSRGRGVWFFEVVARVVGRWAGSRWWDRG